MIGRELGRLARLMEADSLTTARRNSGRLRALLSFAPLITRRSVMSFLQGTVQSWRPARLARTREIVGDLVEHALLPVPLEETFAYAPQPSTAPARHASLSANAVLLGLLCAGGRATVSTLFRADDAVARLTRTVADEEDLRAFIRSAARWLDSRPQGDLTELWVTVVESGFPPRDVSPRMAYVERAVRASAGELPHSQVSAVRLRRALRLGADR